MPGHFPSLDRDELTALGALVREMHESNGSAIPMDQLVRLAKDTKLPAGITIDFHATRDLNQPMVVLRMNGDNQPAPCLQSLSKRERQIAALITDGRSNKEIAKQLFLALATVKDHVHRILHKTGLSNRAAVAAAVQGHQPAGEGG